MTDFCLVLFLVVENFVLNKKLIYLKHFHNYIEIRVYIYLHYIIYSKILKSNAFHHH